MPRQARIRIAGIPMHAVQRGINRAPCFFRTTDRLVYLSLLGEMARQEECAIHAYVLMTNHVHLLLTPQRADSASMMMKHLGQRYVQYLNRARQRSGSLWEGRFRSSLVDSDVYLLRCHRYIEMNPVRAGMVQSPAEHPWSSHRTNALGESSALVTPHPQFIAIARDEYDRRLAYRGMFDTPLAAGELAAIRDALNGGFALGSPRFLERVGQASGRRAFRSRLPSRPAASPGGFSRATAG